MRNRVCEDRKIVEISEGRDTIMTKNHYAGEFAHKEVVINCQTKNTRVPSCLHELNKLVTLLWTLCVINFFGKDFSLN